MAQADSDRFPAFHVDKECQQLFRQLVGLVLGHEMPTVQPAPAHIVGSFAPPDLFAARIGDSNGSAISRGIQNFPRYDQSRRHDGPR